jgi:AcrR family transcriptional regulator
VEQPTGRRLTADQRRKQLLDAVSTLAADPDVEALSVEELAAHAGVSEGLLHHYFPSKQALVLAAVRRAAGVLSRICARRRPWTDPPRSVLQPGCPLISIMSKPSRWAGGPHCGPAPLLSSFGCPLEAIARHDLQTAHVLTRLAIGT